MSNIFRYLIILFFLNDCSFDNKSGIWTDEQDLKIEKKNTSKIFVKEELIEKEFNPNLQIKLSSKLINNSFENNLTNNNGRINYDGDLTKKSKYKFSKIANFKYYEPELIFESDNLIFFDKKGTIIKFDSKSNIVWEKNYYNNEEKKLKPFLTFGQNLETLIISDNISKYFALNLNDGSLLWSKYNSSPFNSQIKTYKDNFFLIDFNNILRCLSIKDGTEIWSVKANNTFIKSKKKLSIVVIDDVLYFNNSTGDITAVDVATGKMLWQTPTQNSTIYENTFMLKTSNIVANKNMLIFSNNKNKFYSLNLKTGKVNWIQNVNSSLQPTIVNDLIFSITNEGYLTIIESKTGNIIKITDTFSLIKKNKRNKINPVGFVVAKKIFI